MSKKVQKLYFELITEIGKSGQEPMCADPEYIGNFFPEPKRPQSSRLLDYSVQMKFAEAKLICNLCPFKAKCAEYAIVADEEFGVWGGLTPSERSALKRGRPISPEVVRVPLLDD